MSPAALSRAAVDLHMTCIKTEGGACTPWSAKCWGVPYMLDAMHFLKLWQNLEGQKWMKTTTFPVICPSVSFNCLKYPNSTRKDVIWSVNANCYQTFTYRNITKRRDQQPELTHKTPAQICQEKWTFPAPCMDIYKVLKPNTQHKHLINNYGFKDFESQRIFHVFESKTDAWRKVLCNSSNTQQHITVCLGHARYQ